jgi:hypothetical protein
MFCLKRGRWTEKRMRGGKCGGVFLPDSLAGRTKGLATEEPGHSRSWLGLAWTPVLLLVPLPCYDWRRRG